jgi:ABC-type phosphate/phosphonate transport system ATPase subunit
MVMTLTEIEQAVEATLVHFLHDVAFARRLWMRADDGRLTFWLETAPVSHEVERTVYEANVRIHQRIPDARFDFLVINPAMYDEPFVFEPPLGAQQIPLH